MFDNEKSDAARTALHKKAFASYKAFEFLKHGVEFNNKRQGGSSAAAVSGEQSSKFENSPLDPYNFPQIN